MINSNTSVHVAVLGSLGDIMFSWKWYLRDIKQDKDVKVFSTFSCGGGSSMGYKRAGFDVIGCCEIDPRVNKAYVANNHPKYNFVMDLRDFNKLEDLPDELYNLDILDGSPPCSTFSMAGDRERFWGKEKMFREGQKKQTLDDLFFVFLETVKKLKPKIVVAENVVGLISGNAKGYVSEIIKGFHDIGYEVQIFKLNAAVMDVPQVRERVFFIANRCGFQKLSLRFNEPPIAFGEVREEHGKVPGDGINKELLKYRIKSDNCLADISERIRGKKVGFTLSINQDERVANTLTTRNAFRGYDGCLMTDNDCRNIQSFPQDYDFCGQNAVYLCAMSVPPNMMANVANAIWEQWLK